MSLHELCRVEGSAQEKRRKEKQGLPADRAVPSVDWGEAGSSCVRSCFCLFFFCGTEQSELSILSAWRHDNLPKRTWTRFSSHWSRWSRWSRFCNSLQAEERAQYLTTTRAMETKFAQLIKLRRLLQAWKLYASRYYNIFLERPYSFNICHHMSLFQIKVCWEWQLGFRRQTRLALIWSWTCMFEQQQ